MSRRRWSSSRRRSRKNNNSNSAKTKRNAQTDNNPQHTVCSKAFPFLSFVLLIPMPQ